MNPNYRYVNYNYNTFISRNPDLFKIPITKIKEDL